MATKAQLEKQIKQLRKQIEQERSARLLHSQERFFQGIVYGRKQMAGELRTLLKEGEKDE